MTVALLTFLFLATQFFFINIPVTGALLGPVALFVLLLVLRPTSSASSMKSLAYNRDFFRIVAPYTAYILLGFVSIIWSRDAELSLSFATGLLARLLLFFIVTTIFWTLLKNDIHFKSKILTASVLSGVFIWLFLAYLMLQYGSSLDLRTLIISIRDAGYLEEDLQTWLLNHFTTALLIKLVLFVVLSKHSPNRLVFTLGLINCALISIIVLTATSRINVLIFFTFAGLLLFREPVYSFKRVGLMFAGTLGTVLALFVFSSEYNAFTKFVEKAEDNRILILKEASQDEPLRLLFGNGIHTKVPYRFNGASRVHEIHNLALSSLYELGLLGLAFILFFFLGIFRMVWKRYRQEKMFSKHADLNLLMLALIPLMKMQTNGASGNPGPVDLFALAIFFTVYRLDKKGFNRVPLYQRSTDRNPLPARLPASTISTPARERPLNRQ